MMQLCCDTRRKGQKGEVLIWLPVILVQPAHSALHKRDCCSTVQCMANTAAKTSNDSYKCLSCFSDIIEYMQ